MKLSIYECYSCNVKMIPNIENKLMFDFLNKGMGVSRYNCEKCETVEINYPPLFEYYEKYLQRQSIEAWE